MKKHILIVDDERDISDLLAQFLSQSGYDVKTVTSAMEAEQAVVQQRPDLIISDLQLEDSDGLEMIDRIKRTLPDTPVLLLTGVFFDPVVVRDTLSKKVSAYVQKTAPLGQILAQVMKLLGP